MASDALGPDCRLATYGSLAPGRENHHRLAGLSGRWLDGVVCGRRVSAGWGAALGYSGLILDPAGDEVAVKVFESADLPAHWPRLDEHEGSDYRRAIATVHTDEGDVAAWIYALATEPAER